MVLWADSKKNLNEWIDAFEYILTDFRQIAPSQGSVFDMLQPQTKNSFVVSLAKSLEEDEDSPDQESDESK